jgi:endonuclease YncB( thermonuclease family)
MCIEVYGVDSHHRFLGTFFLDGHNLNLALVEAGLAEVSRDTGPSDPYRMEYKRAETSARAAMRGMWVLGEQYESPSDYRRRLHLAP